MTIVVPILAFAAVVWGLVYARRGSLLVGTVLFIAVGYVFTNDFWHLNLGPLPITLGRLLLAALVGLFCWRWWRGRISVPQITAADYLGLALICYITLRWLMTSSPEGVVTGASATWRLIASFWMPATVYLIARNSERNEKNWKALLMGLTGLGVYLALTGLAEVTGQWWAVFPRFIADPELGTHFGRARGPALMSASLGAYLAVCFWAAWFLWAQVGRPGKLVLVGAMLLMCVALYFTYTRSTYLALAAGLAVVPCLHFPRQWKSIVALVLILGLGLGGAVAGKKLIDMGRTDTDGSASHSVFQRASFLYVSVEMFQDYPIAGCGFGRFYDMKMTYLADRSQAIELESIRPLDHHNTFLSILTETGLIGFTLFVAVIASWFYAGWKLARDSMSDNWVQSQGLFTVAVVLVYGVNALFHDLTLSPSEQWIIGLTAGLTVGLRSASLGNRAQATMTPASPQKTEFGAPTWAT